MPTSPDRRLPGTKCAAANRCARWIRSLVVPLAVLAAQTHAGQASAQQQQQQQQKQQPLLQQRPAAQGPEPQKLTAQQVAQSLSGNSTVVQMPSGGGRPPMTVTIFYDPNGTVLFSSSDGTVDQGIWRVTPEGKYCSRWQRLRKGFESCADVLRNGEVLHFVENSSEFVTRLVAGNVLRQTRR